MLRFVVLADAEGAIGRSGVVVVFRAAGWPEANERAMELGRSKEEEYVGGKGELVRSRFEKVETLDLLGRKIVDAREVYHQPSGLGAGEHFAFNFEFEPGAHPPGSSGV